MDLNDIRTFVTVAETGTLSAAAKELNLPVSTVSRSITRLERNLGVLVVQRSPRGLVLTDAGKQYLQACKRALRSLRTGREIIEEHRGNPDGLIRLACPMTMAREVLAPILKDFIDSYPKLRVQIEPYCSGWDQEPKQEVDIFFKVRTPKDSTWRVRNYPGTIRGLFASQSYLAQAGYPSDPAELVSHRCIGSGIWKLTRGAKIVVPKINFQVETSDPAVHLELTLKSVGIAVLPLWMVKRPELARALSPVLPSWKPSPVPFCALYTGSAKLTPKVKLFLDFLEAYMGTARDPRLNNNRPEELFTRVRA